MNRDLQQVRRYWPRARYAGWNWHGWQSEDDPGVLYMRYSSERRWWRKRYELCLDEEQGGWRVIDSNQDQLGRGDTIAEAMRVAGFGMRPEYATRGYHFAVWRAKKVSSREQVRLWRAGCGWSPAWLIREYERFDRLPELVARQRPRKGARLGRRKREVQP